MRWHGIYAGVEAVWLRWATLEGKLLPTDQEALTAEMRRAEAETQRAVAAEAEVARLRVLLAAREGPATE